MIGDRRHDRYGIGSRSDSDFFLRTRNNAPEYPVTPFIDTQNVMRRLRMNQ